MFAFPPFPWQDPNSRSQTPSMERSAKSRRTESAGPRRLSNASQSSTSSGIQVAPGPASTSRAASQVEQTSQSQVDDASHTLEQLVTLEVHDKRNLVFKFPAEKRDLLKIITKGDDSKTTTISSKSHVKDDDVIQDDSEGPNHRGTYSRKYTERHPEITWIHRGQGRYLPASESKTLTTNNQSGRCVVSSHSVNRTFPVTDC